MKNMKKLLALVIAVAMVLAMGVSVFAATPAADKTTENDGSVEVKNAKEGQTYTLYKLFDADMGANDAITYTLPTGKTEADLTYGTGENAKSWFELNNSGFVVAKSGTENEWAKDPDAKAWAKSFGTKVGEPIVAGTVKWEQLPYGYYFVDTSLGAFIGVDSANKNAEINEKNDQPTVDKEIKNVAGNTSSLGVGDDTTDPGHGANEKAIAQVGDTVNYKITVAAKPGAENYIVTDTLSDGLTAPAASAVTVTSPALTKDTDYTVTVEGQKITVTFTKAYLDTIKENTSIVIEYPAVVNNKAVIGEAGNPNTVTLKYGHDPSDSSKPGNETPPDEAKVYVAKISVVKKDGNDGGLAGAVFALKNSAGKYYKFTAASEDVPAKVEWVDAVGQATTFTSGSDGKLDGEFVGLSNGSYTLEEVTVPNGYNPIDPDDDSLKFTIEDTDYTNNNLIQSTEVVNNAGSELPTTGGIGTTIFYIVGAILVVGGGILLISRRRTSSN